MLQASYEASHAWQAFYRVFPVIGLNHACTFRTV
jgi:hypothetical protein